MKTKLIALTLIFAGCSDTATFINGKDGTNGKDYDAARIADLEARMSANEALDELQANLIQANNDAIAALALRVTTQGTDQAAATALLQAQINNINESLSTISNSITALQLQVNDNSSNISSIQESITNLYDLLGSLEDALDDTAEDLQGQIDDLNDLLAGLPSGSSISHSSSTSCQHLTGSYYTKGDTLYLEPASDIAAGGNKLCKNNEDKVSLSNADSLFVTSTKLVVKVSSTLLIFSF